MPKPLGKNQFSLAMLMFWMWIASLISFCMWVYRESHNSPPIEIIRDAQDEPDTGP